MSVGILAALGAGLGVAKGIGGAVAAKRSFSEEEERRLRELQMLQNQGELGLSEVERQGLEAQLGGQRATALRQAQTFSDQRAQASGGSGRDLFLAEMAGQEAEQQARVQGEQIIAEQESAARQAQQAELMGLAQQEAASKAGVISALTGGIVEGGQAAVGAGLQYYQEEKQFEREAKLEEARIVRVAADSGLLTQDQVNAFLDGGVAKLKAPEAALPSLEELEAEATKERQQRDLLLQRMNSGLLPPTYS